MKIGNKKKLHSAKSGKYGRYYTSTILFSTKEHCSKSTKD